MVNVKFGQDEYIKSYSFKLYPDEEQAKLIDRYIDLSRYIYNWALNAQIEHRVQYMNDEELYEFYSKYELERCFTKLRNSEGYEFLKEMPHISERISIHHLLHAIDMYKRGHNNFPSFKSKKNKRNKSFGTRADRMFFNHNYLYIEGFYDNPIDVRFETGWLKDYKRIYCPKFYNPIVVKKPNNTYWISFGVITKKERIYFIENKIAPYGKAIGIDLNVKKRIQLSNGRTFNAIDLSKEVNKMKKAQRKVNKDRERFRELEKTNPDITPSNRSIKRFDKYRKKVDKIANKEENFIQTSTKEIIKMNPSMVVMEDFKMSEIHNGFSKKEIYNRHCNFYRIKEVMRNKCIKYDIPFRLAPLHYPSSQICSNCGNQHNIKRNKIYRCPVCGMKLDRDINAAKNLESLAYIDNYKEFYNQYA